MCRECKTSSYYMTEYSHASVKHFTEAEREALNSAIIQMEKDTDSLKNINVTSFLTRSLAVMSEHGRIPLNELHSSGFEPIEYIFNSHGYRSCEINNQEILTLGCSQTEGHGLPIELTWPYLISKKMNKGYVNLAKGGDGAQSQINKAFQFFKEFYNPKYIFAVFPLERLEIPQIGIKTLNPSDLTMSKGMFHNENLQKYSKAPHLIEGILPEEFAIFYNIMFINMLIQYCDTNNIKLLWTHYSKYDKINRGQVKTCDEDSIPSYFNSDYLLHDANPEMRERYPMNCHSEFSDHKLFNEAADRAWALKHGKSAGHWGFHKQIHVAESIYSML